MSLCNLLPSACNTILTESFNAGRNSQWLLQIVESGPPVGVPNVSDLNEKYSDEVEKLLEMGKEKEYLTFDDINRLLPSELNSADDIEAIFDVIGAEGISISDNDEKFLEVAASVESNGDGKLDGMIEEEIDLDLTTGILDKTN